MPHDSRLSRRTVLKGLGISLALPWLESAMPMQTARAAAAGSAHPLRMAFLFVPNGMHMQDWTPQTEGYGFRLPYILEPLANVQDDLVVLTGLTHDKGRANGDGPGDHARSASAFLTGCQPRKTSAADIRVGVSVDQYAAQKLGSATRFPSIQLGCERGRSAGSCDSGYSCAYSHNISWASESTPLGKQDDPREVFDRLFASDDPAASAAAAAERNARKKSILDYLADDASRLQSRLGQSDRRKVEEYLTGVRELEQRIVRAQGEGGESLASGRNSSRPAGIPRDYGEHLRLMCDMMVLAFQSDLTRIATFMLADEGSNRGYREISIPDGHHDLSHHGNDPRKQDKIRQINRFHVQQLAYLLEKLKAIPAGEGSLLDHCMIVYGAGISDGNRHNDENLPVLLAGRGGGSIDTGRHVRYEFETPMTNLFLSMLDRFGAPADYLGDSTGRLPGLSV
jgi:hypothetical protein